MIPTFLEKVYERWPKISEVIVKRLSEYSILIYTKKCYRKISLKEDQKAARKSCCQWIRKNIDRSKVERLMFTDEKIFTRNGFLNPKNDVVWADDRSDTSERGGLHLMGKYPISIMIALGVTCSEFTRSYFFQKGERLNGQADCDRLLPFYKEEDDRLFGYKN